MSQHQRALTRAARDRARRTGEKYTQAREAVLVIRELMDDNDWTYDEAEAWYDDPRNQLMCDVCGWTYGMVCPECIPGCGCNNGRCTGWRHQAWPSVDPDDLECPDVSRGSRRREKWTRVRPGGSDPLRAQKRGFG